MNNLKRRYITIAIYLNIGSLLFTGCINNQPNTIASHTKVDSSWQEFSKSYKSTDYNIRKEIDYFELRKYIVDIQTGKLMTPKYISYLPIYREPLSSVAAGFYGDPEILVPLGLSTILSDTRLVTPWSII